MILYDKITLFEEYCKSKLNIYGILITAGLTTLILFEAEQQMNEINLSKCDKRYCELCINECTVSSFIIAYN